MSPRLSPCNSTRATQAIPNDAHIYHINTYTSSSIRPTSTLIFDSVSDSRSTRLSGRPCDCGCLEWLGHSGAKAFLFNPRFNFAVPQVETKHSSFSMTPYRPNYSGRGGGLIAYYDYLDRIPLLALSGKVPNDILAGIANDKAILPSFTKGFHLLGT